LEFNVPCQHKYGYIRDEPFGDSLTPSHEWRVHHTDVIAVAFTNRSTYHDKITGLAAVNKTTTKNTKTKTQITY